MIKELINLGLPEPIFLDDKIIFTLIATNKKYREIFSVSRKTALRDLSRLIDKDLIRKEGVRRWAKFAAK